MVILAFPFKIIWAFGVVWGNASSAQKGIPKCLLVVYHYIRSSGHDDVE